MSVVSVFRIGQWYAGGKGDRRAVDYGVPDGVLEVRVPGRSVNEAGCAEAEPCARCSVLGLAAQLLPTGVQRTCSGSTGEGALDCGVARRGDLGCRRAQQPVA